MGNIDLTLNEKRVDEMVLWMRVKDRCRGSVEAARWEARRSSASEWRTRYTTNRLCHASRLPLERDLVLPGCTEASLACSRRRGFGRLTSCSGGVKGGVTAMDGRHS